MWQGSNSAEEGCPIPDVAEGELPKCDSTYSIDIPNSVTLWEADPRPERSAEVSFIVVWILSVIPEAEILIYSLQLYGIVKCSPTQLQYTLVLQQKFIFKIR